MVFNTLDTVSGQPGANDTVYAAVNFTLPDNVNVDTLKLIGSATQAIGNHDSDLAWDVKAADAVRELTGATLCLAADLILADRTPGAGLWAGRGARLRLDGLDAATVFQKKMAVGHHQFTLT